MACSVLLLDGIISIVSAGLQGKFALNAPSMVVHIVNVEVLVSIVPADDIQEVVIVEDIVRERANLWQAGISLHQVLLDVEPEAFMRSDRLVEAAKDQDSLAVDRHAHGEIAGCPRGLRVQVDHAPHVVVDVVHLDRVCDLFLVELGTTTENVDVLVVEDTTRGGVPGHVQVGDPAPGIVLDVILLTSRVEALGVIAANNEDEATLRIEGSEIRSLEEKGRLVLKFGAIFFELHHPVTAHVVLMSTADAENSAFISDDRAAEFRNTKLIV